MAWVINNYSIQFMKDGSTVSLSWRCIDDAETGAQKSGSFDHTVADGDTWSTIKSAIETKITAFEGVDT